MADPIQLRAVVDGRAVRVEIDAESADVLARAVAAELRRELDQIADARGALLALEASSRETLAEVRGVVADLRDARADAERAASRATRLAARVDATADRVDAMQDRLQAVDESAQRTHRRVPIEAAGAAGLVALIAQLVLEVWGR